MTVPPSPNSPPEAFPEMDRIALTRRPNQRVVMRQDWYHLLFLHWTVPSSDLQALLPSGLTLDTFHGQAYVGLVPFTMRNVRPIWSPSVPGLSHFHEVNVRTYVHRNGRNPGVWFFSLDAANSIAVRLARALFKLPYYRARMSLALSAHRGEEKDISGGSASEPAIEYQSDRLWPAPIPAHCHLRYSPKGEVRPATPGTLEHFLVERYLLYSYANGQLYTGQVHHTPYPLQTAELETLEENLIAAGGIIRPDTPPPLIHYAREVRVTIHPLRACS